MFFLSSLSRSHAERAPLTEQRMMRILYAHHCTVRFRFGGVFAVNCADQEYYVCRTTDLAGMTVQHFTAALTTAFSFRVRGS
jgi:hypothetical protein